MLQTPDYWHYPRPRHHHPLAKPAFDQALNQAQTQTRQHGGTVAGQTGGPGPGIEPGHDSVMTMRLVGSAQGGTPCTPGQSLRSLVLPMHPPGLAPLRPLKPGLRPKSRPRG